MLYARGKEKAIFLFSRRERKEAMKRKKLAKQKKDALFFSLSSLSDVEFSFFFYESEGTGGGKKENKKRNQMPASPLHPSSPVRRGGATSPFATSRENEVGSTSKNLRRNQQHSSTSPPPLPSSSPLPALSSQSPPALAFRTLLGFALGSLGVLTFLWFSSQATTNDGVPSTLLLARQRSAREVSFCSPFFFFFFFPRRDRSLANKKKSTLSSKPKTSTTFFFPLSKI